MEKLYISILVFIFISLNATILNSQCIDETHSPFAADAWLSCNTSSGPIPQRGENHWIMYDFGQTYTLDSLYIWNYNVWGQTGSGMKQILIDYSTDQSNWNTIGPVMLEEAPGSWKYNTPSSINIGNVQARYFMITAIQTFDPDASCAGLGEIKITLGSSTDVEEIASKEDVALYPNPVEDILYLSFSDNIDIRNIMIYNTTGQLVKNTSNIYGSNTEITATDLDAGIYYLMIQSDKGQISRKFVKARL
jgi:hypothetical protein